MPLGTKKGTHRSPLRALLQHKLYFALKNVGKFVLGLVDVDRGTGRRGGASVNSVSE